MSLRHIVLTAMLLTLAIVVPLEALAEPGGPPASEDDDGPFRGPCYHVDPSSMPPVRVYNCP